MGDFGSKAIEFGGWFVAVCAGMALVGSEVAGTDALFWRIGTLGLGAALLLSVIAALSPSRCQGGTAVKVAETDQAASTRRGAGAAGG